MSNPAIILVTLPVAALGYSGPVDQAKWTSCTSPARFYTVEHLDSWYLAHDENVGSLASADDTRAGSISAFHGDPPIRNALLADRDDDHPPSNPPQPRQGHHRRGLVAGLDVRGDAHGQANTRMGRSTLFALISGT